MQNTEGSADKGGGPKAVTSAKAEFHTESQGSDSALTQPLCLEESVAPAAGSGRGKWPCSQAMHMGLVVSSAGICHGTVSPDSWLY